MKILRKFEAAVRADEMAGSQEPQDAVIIRKEYRDKKKEIKQLLKELQTLIKCIRYETVDTAILTQYDEEEIDDLLKRLK
jgi:phosphoglycolate phosphatase-like HAD superfamily hydrolase